MEFDLVFVPGLAERMFPRKIVEDPLLLDELRRKISTSLPQQADRIAKERLALRLAIGADYFDACPIRGVRSGGGAETMSAAALVAQQRQQ